MHLHAHVAQKWPRMHGLLSAAVAAPAAAQRVRLTAGGAAPARVDALIVGAAAVDAALLDAARPARLLLPHAGITPGCRDAVLALPPAARPAVHNVHANAAPTAELAVALLLAAARRVVPADRDLRAGAARRSVQSSGARRVSFAARTAVVLGYGAVGARVSRALAGLGMRVAAVRRRAGGGGGGGGVEVHPPSALPRLLSGAAVVVACLPLTPETDGVLGAAELALLGSGAVVVNVGRAGVVDEEAMWDFCRSGRGAYASDVWWREDAAEGTFAAAAKGYADGVSRHDFASLDNVVMTPHIAGGRGFDDVEEDRAAALADLVRRIADGGDPPQLDLDAGY